MGGLFFHGSPSSKRLPAGLGDSHANNLDWSAPGHHALNPGGREPGADYVSQHFNLESVRD
jgi:hypothetical protein